MTIADDNELLGNPELCSECQEPAYTIIFEKSDEEIDGIKLKITRLYAKCLDHLLQAEMDLIDVSELD